MGEQDAPSNDRFWFAVPGVSILLGLLLGLSDESDVARLGEWAIAFGVGVLVGMAAIMYLMEKHG